MLKSVPLDFATFWGICRKRFQVAIVLTLIQDTRRFYFLCAALPPCSLCIFGICYQNVS